MTDVQTSAPGKVIVAGEYAVLDGAPAVCMAVDRRAHVSITSSDDDYHSVLAPGFSEVMGRFRSGAQGLDWIEGEAEFSLLAAVWSKLAIAPVEHLSVVLDSNEFIDIESSKKIGIGSSAALAVALTAALDLAAGGNSSIHRIASAAHRDFQGGTGSGADIACSLTGGIIEYSMGDAPDRALRWPDGLEYALLWSGVAVNTAEKLQKLADIDASETRAELVAAANAVAGAWHGGQASEIIAAIDSYTSTLRRFDVDHTLGIFDAGHAGLADCAASNGVVYKPCGAGGGDLGIAISTDPAAIAAFVAQARERDFKHLRLAIETAGLRREGEQL